MNRYLQTITFCLLAFLITLSCCKKEDEPVLDPVPAITLASIAPTTVKQFEDSILLLIEYEDGDGDLGFVHRDSLALQIKDKRLTEPDFYYVPALAPVESEISIQGIIEVVIPNTFLLGSGGIETTDYTLKMKDRSGNWSNTVVSPEITVTP